MWEQFPRAMQVALARHDSILRQAIESGGGCVFKTVGDAFYAVFPSPSMALETALDCQRRLVANDWSDVGSMRVRMALHTGSAEMRDGDYFGPHLNRVARLLSAGHGGQVLLSLTTQELVRDNLPPGTFLKDLGTWVLRDLSRSEHIFQLLAPDLPADFPPLRVFDTHYAEAEPGGHFAANPYKGLRAFHQDDALDFFGREALTARLLERLGENGPLVRFLAVAGPSGSGKSSVVRAGLMPALRQGALPGSARWLTAEMLPGAHPLEELGAVLRKVAVAPPDNLLEQLREDERGLARVIKDLLPQDETVELVLVIDQFEEVFTLVEDEPTRVHLLESLHAAVIDPASRLRVVVTLRADFYDRPLLYPDPGVLIVHRTEWVLPLALDELERAIVRPASRVGVHVEPELVAALLKDVGEQPGTLPLLQYALTELFDKRRGSVMTLSEYHASGGVAGALLRRADALYDQLGEPERRVARQLFLRLVTPGEGTEDTRRRVRSSELASMGSDAEALAHVTDIYGRHRLLTFDRDPISHETTVEVAHEALIGTWPRLRAWLDTSRESLRLQRQLMASAAEWANSGKDPSFLASGVRLSQFEVLDRAARESGDEPGDEPEPGAVALTADEKAYVRASVNERNEQSRARERLRRRIILGLAGGMVLTLILAALALAQSVQANDQRNAALAQADARATAEAVADARRKEAEEQQKIGFSRELAAESRSEMGTNPNLGLLLAVEAVKTWHTREAEEALRLALVQSQPHTELHLELGDAGGSVFYAAFSPDGGSVATTGVRMTRVWEVSDRTGTGGNVIADLPTPKIVRYAGGGSNVPWALFADFSPNGKQLAVTTEDARVHIWDISQGRIIATLAGHSGVVHSGRFSPDGKQVVTASSDGTARVWDASTGELLLKLEGHGGRVSSAAFSPDGKLIVTACGDGTARIWDRQTDRPVVQLAGHSSSISNAAFSPDGKRIVTSSEDGTARVWDAARGDSLVELRGHTGKVTAAAFSPDGKLIVTSGMDNTVRVWDASTGRQLASIDLTEIAPASVTGPVAAVTGTVAASVAAVAFSPDGKRVLFVTGGNDAAARIYPWEFFKPTDDLLTVAPSFLPRTLTCEERTVYLHEQDTCGRSKPEPTP
jgi:WD40 repeat protein